MRTRQHSHHDTRRIGSGRLKGWRQPLGLELLEPRQVLSANVLITEFMASNNSTLADGDGQFPDWVEIYNPTTQSVNLAGWHLTDDSQNPDKWTFPALAHAESS